MNETLPPPPLVEEEIPPRAAPVVPPPLPDDATLLRHGTLATPESEMRWFTPALPSPRTELGAVEARLASVGAILGDHPGWREMLQWTYETRVRPAAMELEAAERQVAAQTEARAESGRQSADDLERRITELENRRETLEKELETEAAGYAEAMGQAGLMAQPADAVAGPAHVREALQDVAPTVDEIAGEHGIVPPSADDGKGLGSVIMEGAAPIVCGFMLAISLGTLTGLLDLVDLQTLRRPPMVFIAFTVGAVIVALIGNLVKATVAGYVMRGEDRYPDAAPVPRLRSKGFLALMATACLLFIAAEVTAEALGLRDLNRQRLIEDARLSSTAAAGSLNVDDRLMALPFFLVIGTLISGPYVAYKAARGWKEGEARQRQAWLSHRRLEHVKALSREEPVQRALGHARRVEGLTKRVEEVDEMIAPMRARLAEVLDPAPTEAMRKRLEYATSAAVGEAMRLHEMVDEMIADVDPLPRDRAQGNRR